MQASGERVYSCHMSVARTSPWAVASAAVLIYVVYVGGLLLSGTDVRAFIDMDRSRVAQGHGSSIIKLDPHGHFYTRDGYDGQYSYYIAVDPLHARPYIDWPAYRYGRILYPALARVAALGQPAGIPAALLLINVLAVGMGVWAIAAWLVRAGVSPWFSLLYAIYPGTLIAATRDLSDVLAISLIALAAYVFRYGGTRSHWNAACLFALAGLTRETTLSVAAVYAVSVLRQSGLRRGLAFAATAALPYLIWREVLAAWLGTSSIPPGVLPTLPLAGLLSYGVRSSVFVLQTISVLVPGLIACVIAITIWRRIGYSPEIGALLISFAVVLIMNRSSYADIFASSRIAGLIPLFLLLVLPNIRSAGLRFGFRVAWLLWLFPYLAVSSLLSIRRLTTITAVAWTVALEVEIVRHLMRGFRRARRKIRPMAAQ